MKNQLIQALSAIFISSSCLAQQKITINKPESGNQLLFQASIGASNVDVKKLNTKEDITISPDPSLTGNIYALKIDNPVGLDITAQQLNISTGVITGISTGKPLNLTFKSIGFQDLTISDIGKEFAAAVTPPSGSTTTTPATLTALEFLQSGNPKPVFTDDPMYVTNILSGRRYFSSQDKAYIVLNENGKLIGNTPVNIDQDDKIYIYVIIDRNNIDRYDLEVIGGEYSPVDLQIRSYDKINDINAHAVKTSDWTIIRFERGPYTSDNVTFNIKKTETIDGKDRTTVLSTYSININKLYHVAIGASFVTTNLAKPDFDVFPLTDTTNTINTLNKGSRTMFTFNVIWYWQNTFKYLRRGSDLTRGRDILKEPNWITRLNPTFGVTLDNTFKENFFIGGTYEFARGGSICFGGHYGKTKELATKAPDGKDFELGKSVYAGTADNIKLTDAWKWGWFIGVTLDTRIFNKLLARN